MSQAIIELGWAEWIMTYGSLSWACGATKWWLSGRLAVSVDLISQNWLISA